MNRVHHKNLEFEPLEQEEVQYELDDHEEPIGVIYLPTDAFPSSSLELGQDDHGLIQMFEEGREEDGDPEVYGEIICSICNASMGPGVNMARFPQFSQNKWAQSLGISNQPHEHYVCVQHFTEAPRITRRISKARYKHDASHYHYRDAQPTENLKIYFRESNFKVKSSRRKSMHHVAVIPVPEDPSQYYEFSYNAKSKDGRTSFYSCLGCRKATAENKIKDRVRTIHLQGNRLLSRYHPLRGHHMACRPILDESRQYMKNLIICKTDPDDIPPKLSPQHTPEVPTMKLNTSFSNKSQILQEEDDDEEEGVIYDDYSDSYSNQIIIDDLGNQYALVPEQDMPGTSRGRQEVVEQIPEEFVISTAVQDDHSYDYTQNMVLEETIIQNETSGHEPPSLPPYGRFMGQVSSTRVKEIQETGLFEGYEDEPGSEPLHIRRRPQKVLKNGLKLRKKKRRPVPKCYLCFRVLKNAHQLANHLLNAHVHSKRVSKVGLTKKLYRKN